MMPTYADSEQAINERLDHFLTLQRDWDSYGAAEIDPHAVTAARWLAHTLIASGARFERFSVVPTSNGEICFEWTLNGIDFIVEVGAVPADRHERTP